MNTTAPTTPAAPTTQPRRAYDPARLRQVRREMGLSAATAASLAGFGQRRLYEYERGERVPSIDRLVALAEVYACPIDAFLSESAIEQSKG